MRVLVFSWNRPFFSRIEHHGEERGGLVLVAAVENGVGFDRVFVTLDAERGAPPRDVLDDRSVRPPRRAEEEEEEERA